MEPTDDLERGLRSRNPAIGLVLVRGCCVHSFNSRMGKAHVSYSVQLGRRGERVHGRQIGGRKTHD